MRKHEDARSLPATIRSPRPGDFPLGSLESRAAARMLAKTRAERNTSEPIVYLPRFDGEEPILYDYHTGLPVCEAEAGVPQPRLEDETKARRNTMRKHEDARSLPATIRSPRPGDFPLGSLESRAAARMLAKTRAERNTSEPIVYLPRFDGEEPILYDYHTGLPVCEAEAGVPQPRLEDETKAPAPLPASGEALEDPPTEFQEQLDVITIEIG